MFYALSWFVVFSLLALWSLGAWAVHAVAVWTVSNAGVLTGAASGIEGLHMPAWLTAWLPPEIMQAMTSWLSGLAPAAESLLQSAPSLAGGLTVAAWVLWGLGCALLVALGVVLHALLAIWRRSAGGPGARPQPGAAA